MVYNFARNGSYYCRLLLCEQNKTKLMFLVLKMRGKYGKKGSPTVEGFLEAANGGWILKRKNPLDKKKNTLFIVEH